MGRQRPLEATPMASRGHRRRRQRQRGCAQHQDSPGMDVTPTHRLGKKRVESNKHNYDMRKEKRERDRVPGRWGKKREKEEVREKR